ncbi:pirin family protein [Yersinia similis]|uniref:Pirin family protein n=1 Tax=Yersinia similis TaxID=367190 RepID=A0A0T9Q793_9GAMM|nr:pirin family protein [Yersinia similis]CNB30080.1 pirin family protein [Yersinia similis]CNF16588.1 pirin family protein [Yersinia similis]CNF37237.1 pirin family protein [Yersinia similis]CNH98623.1 pirin family protein [Yersinia similis]
MTAGAGILHEEFHSDTFAQKGGPFEMVQLWVNLPAKDKMTAPGYQAIRSGVIPQVNLPDDAGNLRVIAGEYAGNIGPAKTFSPLNVWDIRLTQGNNCEFSLPTGWNTALIVLHGTLLVNGDAVAREAEMVLLDPTGTHLNIEANNDAVLLLLSGEPIDEPIVGYGPFVMNTQTQIAEAIGGY